MPFKCIIRFYITVYKQESDCHMELPVAFWTNITVNRTLFQLLFELVLVNIRSTYCDKKRIRKVVKVIKHFVV